MAVGFGDAGAEIIADNMRSGGDLNPMVPGQKVTAIFGFCDVRQFTDTTEILQVRVRTRPARVSAGDSAFMTQEPCLTCTAATVCLVLMHPGTCSAEPAVCAHSNALLEPAKARAS